MSPSEPDSPTRKPIRLWPGVLIVVLQWLARFGLPVVAPDALLFAVMGGLLGGVLILAWWLFFSRAPWNERLAAPALAALALWLSRSLAHESIVTGGQGMLFFLLAVPVLSLAFVAWALLARDLEGTARWATMAGAIFLSCALFGLVRTGGLTADFDNQLAWRWSPTAEDRLLAEAEPVEPAKAATIDDGIAEWPGYRGADRDDVIRGTRIAADWTASPPQELWRRPVGPGWSSFAVQDGVIYTQEQRGDEETVAAYDLATGEPVWRHGDAARFWESNAGAGPRATPMLHDGRVYALGATGLLNALDARDGSVIWSRDAAADAEMKAPDWGFSGSPLALDDTLWVPVSGRLVAYEMADGELRWKGPDDGVSYTSPHGVTLDGVGQVLMQGESGLRSFAADGTVLWQHAWEGYPIVQPVPTPDGDLLLAATAQSGTRRLSVEHGPDGWSAEERWTSIRLKPYFNGFVVHEGHAYGFDGAILASIDLENGERQWKGGRYGHGQLLLLAEQDVLLVLSERGELALVGATPEGFEELARIQALEGKAWNHPVLVDDVLLVRNDREMAAYRLAKVGD